MILYFLPGEAEAILATATAKAKAIKVIAEALGKEVVWLLFGWDVWAMSK